MEWSETKKRLNDSLSTLSRSENASTSHTIYEHFEVYYIL